MFVLNSEIQFPDPALALPSGLVAIGGDLSQERLLCAYRMGIFPWYENPPILWFSPDPRMVLRPNNLHVSRTLRRTLRTGRFDIKFDTDFSTIIRRCASSPRTGQDGTWINNDMIAAYCQLHNRGVAHSVGAWVDDKLVGGLYGVALGNVFFGESMFSDVRDASKVAFVALVQQLIEWEFQLIDCQVHTAHLARFGAILMPRARFLKELQAALGSPEHNGSWSGAST